MENEVPVQKARVRKGWPKGKPRKPRLPASALLNEEPVVKAPPREVEVPMAPIHVRVRLKGQEPQEFGCGQRWVENGFHVFVYPSARDPYRMTRREIAISEVIEIEITEAGVAQPQPVYDLRPPTRTPQEQPPLRILPVEAPRRPVIHSAKEAIRRAAASAAEALEKTGPERIESIEGITMGDSVG